FSDLPGDVLEDPVSQKAHRQTPHVNQALLGLGSRQLAAPYRAVQRRKRLRSKECRREKLVLRRNGDSVLGSVEGSVRGNDESGHRAAWIVFSRASLLNLRGRGTPRPRTGVPERRQRQAAPRSAPAGAPLGRGPGWHSPSSTSPGCFTSSPGWLDVQPV